MQISKGEVDHKLSIEDQIPAEFSASVDKFKEAFQSFRGSCSLLKEAFQELWASFVKYLDEEAQRLAKRDPSWFLSTGAARHICYDKAMFSTYEPITDIDDTTRIMRGPDGTALYANGTGNVVLKMTGGLTLTLENVRHVPKYHMNVVSGSELSKSSLKLVFEGDKVVLTKGDGFVGDGDLVDGFFKLNATTTITSLDNTTSVRDKFVHRKQTPTTLKCRPLIKKLHK